MVKIQMKSMNKHVEDTRNQISNTIQILSGCGLTRVTKDIVLTQNHNEAILTWDNHIPGRHNAGKSFTTLNQYISIYETGAYHCILFDGSIIRTYFKFSKNILLQEILLYWPAPLNIPEDEVDELGIREAISMSFSDQGLRDERSSMRSPVRFDFDPSKSNENHPETHIHIQHANCRISARRPICFNTFVKFIFKNFYPDIYPVILDDLHPLNYSGYNICEKAVVCL